MTTKHITIEGVLHDAGIKRAEDAEVVGASINEDGNLVVSVQDTSDEENDGFETPPMEEVLKENQTADEL